jgi:hypothetical protein
MLLKTLLPLLPLALLFAACATLPQASAPSALKERTLGPSAVVTITKVWPPWYAARFLIVRGFRKAVPEYQAIEGLQLKQFSIASDGRFGGVYLWKDKASAEAWFSPRWFERVKRTYGKEGEVRYLEVTRSLEGPTAAVEEGPMVVAIAPGALDAYAGAKGLRSARQAGALVVSAWTSRAEGEARVGSGAEVEWFDSPVAIDNTAAASPQAAAATAQATP